MNGSNGPHESNSKPIYECPICLRKLQSNLQFDILERYKLVEEYCVQNGVQFEDS